MHLSRNWVYAFVSGSNVLSFVFFCFLGQRRVGYHWDYTKAVMSNFHILPQIYLLKG